MKQKPVHFFYISIWRKEKSILLGKLLTTEELLSSIYQIPLFAKILPNFYKLQIVMLSWSRFFLHFLHFQMEENLIFTSFSYSEVKTKTNKK